MLTLTCRQMQLLLLCYRLLQGQESQNILHFFLSKYIRLAGPVPRVNISWFLFSLWSWLFVQFTRVVKISHSFISVFVSWFVKELRDQFVSLGWLDIMSHEEAFEPFFLLSSPIYIHFVSLYWDSLDTVAQILIIPDISWNWECYNKTGQGGELEEKTVKRIFSHCWWSMPRTEQFYNEANDDDLSIIWMIPRCFLSPLLRVRIF